MVYISTNASFSLTGSGSFNIADETFTWDGGSLRAIQINTDTAGLTVTVGLSGAGWYEPTLNLAANSPVHVVINDAGGGSREIEYLKLGSEGDARATSNVNLTHTSVLSMLGGGGVDTVTLGSEFYGTINLRGGNDTLRTGASDSDYLQLGRGDDTVYLGRGYTPFVGLGEGNDRVYLDSKADDGNLSILDAGSGDDTLYFSGYAKGVSFSLDTSEQDTGGGFIIATGFENLSGTKFGDTLFGSSGENTIDAGAGNDTIGGGRGDDLLIGGGGKDRFVFDTALNAKTNVDRISDYNVKADTIVLDSGMFSALAAGKLQAAAFLSNATGVAADVGDRIIYERDTGELFYDANGSAKGGAVHFATLDANLKLTAADFLVI